MKRILFILPFCSVLIIASCNDNSAKENTPVPEMTEVKKMNESERSIQEQVSAPGLKKYLGTWERTDGYKETIEILVDQELGVKVRFPKNAFYAHYNIDEDYLRISGGVGMKLRYDKEKNQIISSRDFAYKKVN